MGKVTIKDVAREAGVSPALVSMVVNARRGADGRLDCKASPATAARVLDVVRRMGYRPNKAAASLRSGAVRTVAVITPDIANHYFSDISRAIEDVAEPEGYTVLFGSSDDNPAKFDSLIDTFIADGLAGLMITPCLGCEASVQRAIDLGIPVVLMNRDIPGLKGVGRVLLDNDKAVRMGLRHLYDRGFRRIEMMSSPHGLSTLTNREQAYVACMHGLGLDAFTQISRVSDDDRQASADKIVDEALARGTEVLLHPGAALSYLSFKALRKLGKRIPEDMGLIGFDGGEMYTLLTPSITQIQQPRAATGIESFGMMRDMIENGAAPRTVLLDPIFTEGGSTACVHPERIAADRPGIHDAAMADRSNSVLVPGVFFDDKGGWTADQQFIDLMGSTVLLAHGLGKPVQDASTAFEVPEGGDYSIMVRTRNWTRSFTDADTPGVFNIGIDGVMLPAVLGTGKSEWHWENAGRVHLEAGRHILLLHDLQGFDARMDCVLLTSADYIPEDDAGTVRTLRKRLLDLPSEPEDAGSYDYIVIGGGVAGMCSAIAAARLGLKVALIHDRAMLGGNNSSEVRVGLGGRLNIGRYPSLGYLLNEFGPAAKGNARPSEVYEDDKKMQAVLDERNITLMTCKRVTAVEKEDDRIVSVTATDVMTYRTVKVSGRLFADCTGDAVPAALAGADVRMGRESAAVYNEPSAPAKGDGITLGASMQWYSEPCGREVGFPDIDWGLDIDGSTVQKVRRGQWYWEVGMADDQIEDAESIRDYGMYVAYSNWSFIKNHASFKDEYSDTELKWLCSVIGKRESRRIMGDLVLTENDLLHFTEYPDGCVSTSWYIDNHEPDPDNAARFARPWLSHGCLRPLGFYPIPFRCLYSRNVCNLMMAGRDISVSHLALGTTRVMRTCAMMGEVTGMAAAVCTRNDCLPRDIWTGHWEELDAMMKKGAGRTDVPYLQVYTLVDTTGARSEDC